MSHHESAALGTVMSFSLRASHAVRAEHGRHRDVGDGEPWFSSCVIRWLQMNPVGIYRLTQLVFVSWLFSRP